jgi:serine protease Do
MNERDSAWARLKARRWASTLGVLVTLAVGILIGTLISFTVRGQDKVNSSDATPITIPPAKVVGNDFSRIAKQIEPAVVNINTEGTMKHPSMRGRPTPGQPPDNGGGGDQDNPFQDFFDHFFGGQGPQGGAIPTRSLGSGVLVDPKGYIITNRHVVEGADRIRVKLADDPDGSLGHDAKVIGVDQETDLAVIKIDVNKPLPTAKLGNSDGMVVGDWVLAVGSPFGLNATVTAGIVSYIGRNIVPSQQFQSFIQTDAAINPGNSGGPLVNMEGQVVGINTAIMTGGEGYEGVGFALPSNTVAQVYNALIGPEHKVVRGSIGVEFLATPNPAVARVYGNGQNGVTISNVVSGGPADQAGLKLGDTIVSVDGKPVKNGDALVADIASRKPGSKVAVGYIRDGKQDNATITIGSRTQIWASRLGLEGGEGGEEAQPQAESKLGLSVQNITADMAQRLGIPQKGVIVTDVKPGSPADDWGLHRGDVLLQLNRQPINNEADFRRLTSGLKSGQDVVFLVRSGRGENAGNAFLGGTLP